MGRKLETILLCDGVKRKQGQSQVMGIVFYAMILA